MPRLGQRGQRGQRGPWDLARPAAGVRRRDSTCVPRRTPIERRRGPRGLRWIPDGRAYAHATRSRRIDLRRFAPHAAGAISGSRSGRPTSTEEPQSPDEERAHGLHPREGATRNGRPKSFAPHPRPSIGSSGLVASPRVRCSTTERRRRPHRPRAAPPAGRCTVPCVGGAPAAHARAIRDDDGSAREAARA